MLLESSRSSNRANNAVTRHASLIAYSITAGDVCALDVLSQGNPCSSLLLIPRWAWNNAIESVKHVIKAWHHCVERPSPGRSTSGKWEGSKTLWEGKLIVSQRFLWSFPYPILTLWWTFSHRFYYVSGSSFVYCLLQSVIMTFIHHIMVDEKN